MKLFLSTLAFFILHPMFGQALFTERQVNCETNTFIVENDSIRAEYQPNEAMLADFLKKIDTRYVRKLRGEVYIQILIDSLGHPCCISLLNETNITTKRLGIVNAVNSMTGWKAPQNMINIGAIKNVNVCAIIKLIFTEDRMVAMRLGYNIKTRFSVLYSTELKRKD
jgi:hypothetical protein